MKTLMDNLSSRKAFAAAASVLVVFGALSCWVWRDQQRHGRVILERHTQDVAIQASRRLQVFVESHLRVASIFAQRWATHENADFSKKRFDEFAAVILGALPGYAAMVLVPEGSTVYWTAPKNKNVSTLVRGRQWHEAVSMLRRGGGVFLSSAVRTADGQVGFYALLPLERNKRSLGYLLVLFQSDTLVKDCFHTRIQSEFHFRLQDKNQQLFQSVAADRAFRASASDIARSEVSFKVRNQTWRLTMMPKEAFHTSWTQGWMVALFGFLFSLGMSIMTFFLVRRIDMYRVARDKALLEIEGRQRAESGRDLAMARLAHLSQKAMAAQEEERARLSVEMHDELGQILTALRLNIELVEKQLQSTYQLPDNLLSKAIGMAEKATDELRRLCKGLRPPLLDDLGLVAAIRLLVDEFRGHARIEVRLHLPKEEKKVLLTDVIALTAYRILQESLTNVRRHANASAVAISLVTTHISLTLTISDDGNGFDILSLGAQQGCGLEGMRERANLAGGRLDIHTAPGQGTRVVFNAPLQPRNCRGVHAAPHSEVS